MDDIPPEITGNLRVRIHAGLLRIDAACQSRSAPRPKLAECLETAYDVFAGELLRAGRQLTGAVLAEIPTWVFQWAWDRWLFMMQPMPAWPGYFTMGDSRKVWQRDGAGLVVEADGTPPASVLGAFEPLSEAGLKAGVRKSLEGRVIWWQAEALTAAFQERATPEADPAKERARRQRKKLLARARSRCGKMDNIASKLDMSKASIYRWVENPNSVGTEKAAAIPLGLRRIAAGRL